MKKIFTLFAALAMVMSMSAKPYLRGSFNGWGTGNEFQNGECTINLAANTKYEFKVDNNGDWSTSYGGAAITSTKCTDVSCSGSNNATIQTTLKGSYTFKWNASTKKISVVYPTEEVVKPKKDITVKAKMPASWTKTIDAWVWTDEDPNGKAVTPEKDGDWYVITQNTAASYIIFRNGATWNGDANQTVDMCFEDNACIQLAQSGSSKATYTNIDCVSEFTLTATANPAEGGSVTGAGVYEEGTTVTLTATPNEGYEFVSWTNGGAEVSTNATYSFVIKANLALVANFKAVEATVYTISTEAVNGTVTGAGVYEEGATVTLTATPADGYNFKNWTVSGAEVSAENPYIFTATADVTVTANFEEIPVEYETVYFVNAQDWEKVCIYTWTPEIGTWPGKEMTKEDEKIGEKDVYSYTVEKGTTFGGLNFNNGDNGKQTGDLTWTAGKYYVIDNWYTKEGAEEKLATPVQTYDYYVVGTFNSWANPDPNHGMTLVGDVYKATVTLNVGANMLKVTNGTWENAKGFDAMGAEYEEVSNDTKDGNILITLTEGKDVVVVYNATTGKVTFEGLTEKVVVTPDVITYVLMGVGGDWTTGIALTANPDNANEYVLLGQAISEGDAVKVVTLINGEKTVYCGDVDEYSVEHSADKDGNIVLAPGTYDFYYKVAENLIYIGAAEPELPTYDVTVADATVSTTDYSIDLAGTWEERTIIIKLWQDNVQGFGEYAANAETGYTCQLGNPYAELTPTTAGLYADNGDGTFKFTATMTDDEGGSYNISVTGAIPADEPEIDWIPMELEISNLTTMDMPVGDVTYLQLMGRNDKEDADVELYLNDYTGEEKAYEVNVDNSSVTFGGMKFTVMDGSITKSVDPELGDVFAGTVHASVEEDDVAMYVEFTLKMYALPLIAIELEDVEIVVNEESAIAFFHATWEGSPLQVEVSGFEEVEFKEYPECWLSIGDDVNAAGPAAVIIEEGVASLEGEFVSDNTGKTYEVMLTGTLPQGPATGVDNVQVEVKTVKMIKNGMLIINEGGREFNAQGATLK